ncbi:hypothetical protein BC937DRAFT_93772 [Endogone sp. FLAS-F59071]|nr:hypothetical protein BC937DRAFT_93772 [Endogone sp. FLAS-F59071]|eukprot:RUS21043.1 hypothetical protein BC937DRAFT_93772 [Endogone sp. FLAS-F59071]
MQLALGCQELFCERTRPAIAVIPLDVQSVEGSNPMFEPVVGGQKLRLFPSRGPPITVSNIEGGALTGHSEEPRLSSSTALQFMTSCQECVSRALSHLSTRYSYF